MKDIISLQGKGAPVLSRYLLAVLLCFLNYRAHGQCRANAVDNGNFSDGLNRWTNQAGSGISTSSTQFQWLP